MKKCKIPGHMNRHVDHHLAFIEYFIDWCIPYLVVILAILIILPFVIDSHILEPWISYEDYSILAIFVADLVFKWYHVRNFMKFVRFYWLEIIAVFPFYLLVRAYVTVVELIAVGETVSEAQKITHEAILLRETKLLRETEVLGGTELGKEAKFIPRVIRFFQRSLRFVWSSLYLTHKHYMHVSKKNMNTKVK